MDSKSPIMLVLFFFFFLIPALSVNPPTPEYCDLSSMGSEVRFPFRLADGTPARRGYQRFDLYCNSENKPIIVLPKSGAFVVHRIDYSTQSLFINDPNLCLPARLLSFNLSASRFRGANTRNYTFFNCSSVVPPRFTTLLCLSGRNHTVIAVNSRRAAADQVPLTCRRITTVSIPMQFAMSEFYWLSPDLTEDLELVWSEPQCWECESEGGICGFKEDTGLQIACFWPAKSRGLPRGARYGIIIGVGIPGLMCVIGLASYVCGKIRAFTLHQQLNSNTPVIAIFNQHLALRSANGLDRSTIESYPITVLGESRRLPEASDGTCTICLSDYQSKEILRTIPQCNHCFHSGCIDDWLKLNGTCPLCRKSLESTPPCSSAPSSTPSPTFLLADLERD